TLGRIDEHSRNSVRTESLCGRGQETGAWIVLRVSVAAYCPKYSSLSASPRDAAANLPPRIRPGDAYMPQMTRNRPESTGCDTKYEVGEALPPNGIRHTTGHTGKQPKPPALNQ